MYNYLKKTSGSGGLFLPYGRECAFPLKEEI